MKKFFLIFFIFILSSNISKAVNFELKPSLTPLIKENIFSHLAQDKNYSNSIKDYYLIIDWALFLNKDINSNPNFVENIDGNVSFIGDVVRVGIALPDQFFPEEGEYTQYAFIASSPSYDVLSSFYDSKIHSLINKELVKEIKKLKPNNIFNNKPYEFIEVEFKRIHYFKNDLWWLAFNNSTNYGCYDHILDTAYQYDIFIAPACIADFYGNWETEGSWIDGKEIKDTLTVAGFYLREDLLQIVSTSLKEKENEFLNALKNNSDQYSWLYIGDGGSICSTESIPLIHRDAAIISKWGGFYEPNLFNNLNDIFIEITQKKQKECFAILLNLEDTQKLKTALDKKDILYNDNKEIIDPSVLTLQIINNFFKDLNIKSEKFYTFFVKYSRDEPLLQKLVEYGISDQSGLDALTSRIAKEAPSLGGGTNQDIYNFLIKEEKAKAQNITIAEFIELENQATIAANKKASEDEAQRKKDFAKKYPYYAIINCGFGGGSDLPLAPCFVSSNGVNTTINLKNGNFSNESKYFQFQEIGYFINNESSLIIDLEKSFYLTAQNASDVLTITIDVYDRSTDQLISSDQASSLYGVATSVMY